MYAKERALRHDVAETVHAGAPDVEVLALELAGPDRFCVFIDHHEGVDHALCQRVTSLLRPYLDEYSIEVSSPGSTRPLRTRSHFSAVAGRRVSVRTEHALEGRKRFRGRVRSAGEQTVLLEETAGGEIGIPYTEIVRGNLTDEGR